MPVPVPNLDDRAFDQLASEARALIPRYFPAWTDHNASDPGITLLELFAFLAEAAIYQINRVPERTLEHFAALVGVRRAAGEPIEQTLARALARLETRHRGVTQAEFEALALQAAPGVARARALVQVSQRANVFPAEQVIRVIIVPIPLDPDDPAPTPTPGLREAVFQFLRARRLITTRVRVEPPRFTAVSIAATVVREATSHLAPGDVERAIRDFLHPLRGGPDGLGWEFGRPLFRSELYQAIEQVIGVDHVHTLALDGDEARGELPLATDPAVAAVSLVRIANLTVAIFDR